MTDRRRQPKVRSDEETLKLVLELKRRNPGITQKRIGELVGLSQSGVCELLQRHRGVGRSGERCREESFRDRTGLESW
jgi:predicted transcriptional regulator